ncbi:Sec-independent protein translocase protein TatC [Pontiella desulfatans]|uniref:Sec-independent protein translocase protein TatC n=2 Tax=Pontiella desulfatans TaxID=2750659 RepID=A0A6C2U6Q1_PONDE|nr:Sec-independent protein translocase protein TatC [Pontiella desulfatans]
MLEKLKSFKGKFRYDDSEMPFLEHLEEFRKTVIRCFIALGVGMLICLPFADHIIAVLRAPAEPYIIKNADEMLNDTSLHLRIAADSLSTNSLVVDADGTRYYDVKAEVALPEDAKPKKGGIRLQFSEPAAAIKMWLTVTFFGGILVSLPFLVFFIGLFVMPGVRDVERKLMTRISFFSGGLFLLGIAMGYLVTLPLALGLMLKIGGQLGGESIWFYNKYIGFALQLLLGFGIAFQLPVVILIMGKMGLVNSTQLREKRRHVIVALLILAMVLTPPDVMTQLLMAAPLILLYEFCIWFLHFSGNREAPPAEDEEPEPDDKPTEDSGDVTGEPSAEETHEEKDSTEEEK